MATEYFISKTSMGTDYNNEADAFDAAKRLAADPKEQATHIYLYKLVAEMDGTDPRELVVRHHGH